jgi:DNA-binding NarL/FixJ family response regulator
MAGTGSRLSPGEQLFTAAFGPGQLEALARTLNLSPRELEITRLILCSEKQSAIADRLGISADTVHTHVQRLYQKVDAWDHLSLALRLFAALRSRSR